MKNLLKNENATLRTFAHALLYQYLPDFDSRINKLPRRGSRSGASAAFEPAQRFVAVEVDECLFAPGGADEKVVKVFFAPDQ